MVLYRSSQIFYLARDMFSMSKRLDSIANSATMQMKERVNAVKASGVKLADLTVGEPDFPTPELVKQAAIEAINKNLTYYTSASGIPDLRNELSQFLKSHNKIDASLVGPENVLVTPGAKQGLFYVLASLLNEGDEVIIPEPCWVSYGDITKLNGGATVFVQSSEKSSFIPSISDIRFAMTRRTRAILINNPVNPTGAFYEKEYIRELVELCEERGIPLISDEIYSDIMFDDNKFYSAMETKSQSVILLSGLSKTAAMTGWRLGYIVAENKLIRDCVKMQQQTATCPSSITQYAAIAALRNYENYFPKMLIEYKKRRRMLVDGIRNIPKFSCFEPKGAFYVFMNVSKLGVSSEEATSLLLEKAHVASVSGSAFGKSGEGYVRLSFATSEENIELALSNLTGI